LIPFREVIWRFVDETTIEVKEESSNLLVAQLRNFAQLIEKGQFGAFHGRNRLALKMPIASLCLPEITAVFETKIVVLHRSLEEIESTRIRRCWPEQYGSAGASKIYSKLFNDILSLGCSCLMISFSDLIGSPRRTMQNVMDYCELRDLEGGLEDALEFIRR
jgi:hypothetical protein